MLIEAIGPTKVRPTKKKVFDEPEEESYGVVLTREQRQQISKELGEGYRFISLMAAAGKGFKRLTEDWTREQVEECNKRATWIFDTHPTRTLLADGRQKNGRNQSKSVCEAA